MPKNLRINLTSHTLAGGLEVATWPADQTYLPKIIPPSTSAFTSILNGRGVILRLCPQLPTKLAHRPFVLRIPISGRDPVSSLLGPPYPLLSPVLSANFVLVIGFVHPQQSSIFSPFPSAVIQLLLHLSIVHSFT
jgi:hypothetical protein